MSPRGCRFHACIVLLFLLHLISHSNSNFSAKQGLELMRCLRLRQQQLQFKQKKTLSFCLLLLTFPRVLVCLQALSGQAVDHTILFSSIAALTGPAGSSNYAAVNTTLDAAAGRLQSQGD